LKQSTAAQPSLILVNPIPDVHNRKPRLLLELERESLLACEREREGGRA